MLFGVGVASATGWAFAAEVVEAAASALALGVRREVDARAGVDGAVMA